MPACDKESPEVDAALRALAKAVIAETDNAARYQRMRDETAERHAIERDRRQKIQALCHEVVQTWDSEGACVLAEKVLDLCIA